MSYILDALKKMEHEKARKARKAGMVSISGELFSDERPQSGRGGPGKIIALVIFTSLLAIAATWYFLRPAEKRVETKTHPVYAPPPPVTVSPPKAAAVQPVPPPQPLPSAPARSVAPIPQPPAGTRISPRPAVSTPQSSDQAPDEGRKVRRRQPVPPPVEQRPLAVAAEPGLSADIRVSGIAWQDERSARRAVINGFLMKEGGIVAGARIVEILHDRVRFSQSGRDFELSLVVSGAGAPAK